MSRQAILFAALALGLSGCGGGDVPAEGPTERRETVFEPMTSTIGRAEGVQQTVNDQAAEQRRRIEDAER